ncbi:MAG: succinate dehydrogenase, cytochrome b556 subunit [Firmicutes bacterium]|jgi:succinate dehydrogenase / fumarate reductase cytochrome b subunit|nr:succinate dehydrogenase, cytochrome b556 subunit [Bacillota bacterium]
MAQRSYRVSTLYRTGVLAWWLHRLTGLLIVAYLYFHLIVLSSVVWPGGPRAFNRMVHDLTTPPFILADLALFAVILYHALNGIRIILMDLGWFIGAQRRLFWTVLAVGGAALLGSMVALLPYASL